jgi:diguanylate cyclase
MFARKRSAAMPLPPTLAVAASGFGYEALHFLTEQGLEHNPVNFALAWRAKADRCGLTAITIDALIMDGRKLTQADVDRITTAEAERAAKAAEASDPRQDALRLQARRLAELTTDATVQSHDFGAGLSSELIKLTGGADDTRQIVDAMIQRTRGVEAQLRDASREIEDLRQKVEASRDDAQRDALTGLLNRRGAMQELSSRRKAASGVIGMCDVDHFKSINDRFGHGVGDRVLKGVAASLAESMGIHPVARWGGEEFLVIMEGVTREAASVLLERGRRDLEARTFRLSDTNEALGSVTMSVGLAELSGRAVPAAIEAADRMLYAAKHAGRNRIAAAWLGGNG